MAPASPSKWLIGMGRALLQTALPFAGMGSERELGGAVSDFKGRHFQGEIVLWAVRWYCRYGVSHRDLEQMTGDLGPNFKLRHYRSMVRARDREAAAPSRAPSSANCNRAIGRTADGRANEVTLCTPRSHGSVKAL
jgi:hypothetical protein